MSGCTGVKLGKKLRAGKRKNVDLSLFKERNHKIIRSSYFSKKNNGEKMTVTSARCSRYGKYVNLGLLGVLIPETV